MPQAVISRDGRPAGERVHHLLTLMAAAQRRESELEAIYIDGRATASQLEELERIRQVIENYQGELDDMGYFNLS